MTWMAMTFFSVSYTLMWWNAGFWGMLVLILFTVVGVIVERIRHE